MPRLSDLLTPTINTIANGSLRVSLSRPSGDCEQGLGQRALVCDWHQQIVLFSFNRWKRREKLDAWTMDEREKLVRANKRNMNEIQEAERDEFRSFLVAFQMKHSGLPYSTHIHSSRTMLALSLLTVWIDCERNNVENFVPIATLCCRCMWQISSLRFSVSEPYSIAIVSMFVDREWNNRKLIPNQHTHTRADALRECI